MKKLYFSLHDSPDSTQVMEIDFHPCGKEYSVSDEQALAIIINQRFPEIKNCNRRIKKLVIIDEDGKEYVTEDFDIYGSLTKIEDEKQS